MSNEQGFVSASDYEAWKREHEFIQRGAQEAAAQAKLARVKEIGAMGAAGVNTARQPQDGPHGVMQNMAYGSSGAGMFKDRPLVDALSARLAGYAGEGGRNEGAVEALDRLLAEVRETRSSGATPALETQTQARVKVFMRSDILAIIRGQKAIATTFQAREALDGLTRIFENLE